MPATLRGLKGYESLVSVLNLNKLPKSKKVFDNAKVTDHHAIIPTGYNNAAMTESERKVYDLVVRHFIANFYPECKISTTTVMGDVNGVEFKVTGKRILEPGWRVVFEYGVGNKEQGAGIIDLTDEKDEDEGKVLPQFVKGERGDGGDGTFLSQESNKEPAFVLEVGCVINAAVYIKKRNRRKRMQASLL